MSIHLFDVVLKVLNEVGDLVVTGLLGGVRAAGSLLCLLLELGELNGGLLQLQKSILAHLGEDIRDQLSNVLLLGRTRDSKGVGGDGALNVDLGEVQHGAVLLEHVDLRDTGDLLGVELLEGGGQLLLVLRDVSASNLLAGSSGSTLSTWVSTCTLRNVAIVPGHGY